MNMAKRYYWTFLMEMTNTSCADTLLTTGMVFESNRSSTSVETWLISEITQTIDWSPSGARSKKLRRLHTQVGSWPQRHANHELEALAMIRSPFAYDLVSQEFMYATGVTS
ncbi:hypothetical protein GQ600_21267 [Phytophthora cactorum]|nr:hypothetical protein GQ600_21267 [Phytophthora cactorum]